MALENDYLSLKPNNRFLYRRGILMNSILLRSWDNGPPPVVDSLNQARLLMTEVNNLKLMPLAGLEKGRNYQIRVQAVCQDKNAYVFSPSGCFKTDWHTVDFTF